MAQFAVTATRDKTIEADTSESRYATYWGTVDIPTYGAVAATTTLTSDAIMPNDGDTVVLGAKTYTFRTALSSPDVINEILIGVSAATALDNIKAAVDAAAGEGTTYSTGTTANATISGGTNTDTTQVFTADTAGVAGNLLLTLNTSAHLSFPGQTLAGGQAATTYVTGGTGTTLSFAGVNPQTSAPVEVELWSDDVADGYAYRYIPGTDNTDGKLFIFTNAGTLAGPLVELGNMNTPTAISGDTKLRYKARYIKER